MIGRGTDTGRSSMPFNMGPTNRVIDNVNHRYEFIRFMPPTMVDFKGCERYRYRSSVPFNMGPTNRVIDKVNHR
jgi:hypothetical protein